MKEILKLSSIYGILNKNKSSRSQRWNIPWTPLGIQNPWKMTYLKNVNAIMKLIIAFMASPTKKSRCSRPKAGANMPRNSSVNQWTTKISIYIVWKRLSRLFTKVMTSRFKEAAWGIMWSPNLSQFSKKRNKPRKPESLLNDTRQPRRNPIRCIRSPLRHWISWPSNICKKRWKCCQPKRR